MSSDGRRHPDNTRIVLRPIGSGLPLGFFSFAIGMVIAACQALEWIPVDEQRQVGMVQMAFVFPLELLASVFAFLARDTARRDLARPLHRVVADARVGRDRLSAGSTSVTVGIYLFGFADGGAAAGDAVDAGAAALLRAAGPRGDEERCSRGRGTWAAARAC
jgi:hypothetical protein